MSDFQEIDEIVPLRAANATDAVPQDNNGFPPAFDFSTAAPGASPAAAPTLPKQAAPRKGIVGVLAALGAALAKWWAVALSFLLKFKVILVAGKLLLTGGTMFLSIFLWSFRFGWPLAVGLVVSIFIHECGHALAARKLGLNVGIMVFIPFAGAFVTCRPGKNVVDDAFVGIMGPVAGTLTAVVCAGLYFATHNVLWLVLAMMGFGLNLFNLTPGRPLDGGWISPLFSAKLMLPGIVLAVVVFHANALVWIMAIMSLPGTIAAWRNGHNSPYFNATARDRWTFGLAYLGLIAFLGGSLMTSYGYLQTHYRRSAMPIRHSGSIHT